MTNVLPAPLVRRRWIEARPEVDGFGDLPAPLRHGYVVTDMRVGAGSQLRTLCGVDAVATSPTPGIPAPECSSCDRAWRAAEGIEQRDAHRRRRRPTRTIG